MNYGVPAKLGRRYTRSGPGGASCGDGWWCNVVGTIQMVVSLTSIEALSYSGYDSQNWCQSIFEGRMR